MQGSEAAQAMGHRSGPGAFTPVLRGLRRFAPEVVVVLGVLLLDLVVLGAVLGGRLGYPTIAVNERSHLKWVAYHLDEVRLVFGFNRGSIDTSLPALSLATAQVGLLAAWMWQGKPPAIGRWLAGGAAIWLWSWALAFSQGWPLAVSQTGALFVAQAVTVVALLRVLPRNRLGTNPVREEQPASRGRLAKWQFTVRGMLLTTTVAGLILGALSYLKWDCWIPLEGAVCGVITVGLLAAARSGRWGLGTAFALVVPAVAGYALMGSFDGQHQWWGPASRRLSHWAFLQYYLPHMAWMVAHAVCVVALVFALKASRGVASRLSAAESPPAGPPLRPGT